MTAKNLATMSVAFLLVSASTAMAQPWSADFGPRLNKGLNDSICYARDLFQYENLYWQPNPGGPWLENDDRARQTERQKWNFGADPNASASNPTQWPLWGGPPPLATTYQTWCHDEPTTIDRVAIFKLKAAATLAAWRQRHIDCANNGFPTINKAGANGVSSCQAGQTAMVPVQADGVTIMDNGDDCALWDALQNGQTRSMDIGTGSIITCDATGPGGCCGLTSVILQAAQNEGMHTMFGPRWNGPNAGYDPIWAEDILENSSNSYKACNPAGTPVNETITYLAAVYPSTDIKVAGMLNPFPNSQDSNPGTCEVYSAQTGVGIQPPDYDPNQPLGPTYMAQQLTSDILSVISYMTKPKSTGECRQASDAFSLHCGGQRRPGNASGPEISFGSSQLTGSIIGHSMGAIAAKFWNVPLDLYIGSLTRDPSLGLRNNGDPIPAVTASGLPLALVVAARLSGLVSCEEVLAIGCNGGRRCSAGDTAFTAWTEGGAGCVFTSPHPNEFPDPLTLVGPDAKIYGTSSSPGVWINMPIGACSIKPSEMGHFGDQNSWVLDSDPNQVCSPVTCDGDASLLGPPNTQVYTGSLRYNPCEEYDAKKAMNAALASCLNGGSASDFWKCIWGAGGPGQLTSLPAYMGRAIADHGWISDKVSKGGGYKQAVGELWSRSKVMMIQGAFSAGACGVTGVLCQNDSACCSSCNYQTHQCN